MSHIIESPRRNGKSQFVLAFNDAVKAAVKKELHGKLDQLIDALQSNTDAINARNSSRGADGLLAALQAEAANDAEPELKQLGQWVFEGEDEKWISAAVDKNGKAYLYTVRSMMLPRPKFSDSRWCDNSTFKESYKYLSGGFDASDWRNSAIDRQHVDDLIDFDDDGDAKVLKNEFLGINPATGASVEWLGVIDDDTPSLTDADLQRIFIQNLCTTILQRMHALNRYSNNSHRIGLDDFKPWDVVVFWTDNSCIKRFALIRGSNFKAQIGDGARTIRADEANEFKKWAEDRYEFFS